MRTFLHNVTSSLFRVSSMFRLYTFTRLMKSHITTGFWTTKSHSLLNTCVDFWRECDTKYRILFKRTWVSWVSTSLEISNSFEKFHLTVQTKKIVKQTNTAWKVSNYVVFSGPYFPVFSPNTGKFEPGKPLHLGTFQVVKTDDDGNGCWRDFGWQVRLNGSTSNQCRVKILYHGC